MLHTGAQPAASREIDARRAKPFNAEGRLPPPAGHEVGVRLHLLNARHPNPRLDTFVWNPRKAITQDSVPLVDDPRTPRPGCFDALVGGRGLGKTTHPRLFCSRQEPVPDSDNGQQMLHERTPRGNAAWQAQPEYDGERTAATTLRPPLRALPLVSRWQTRQPAARSHHGWPMSFPACKQPDPTTHVGEAGHARRDLR